MSNDAMQKALDALCDFDYDKRQEAIAALRAALAEARERIAYLESITTGAEHKAIDAAMRATKK